jgi:tRNA uridine 5-carboxymethylaminomethyl modification enzyme
MIDDLITRGVSEPYRMFTSRAEFRLTLRADNADQRLTPIGNVLGLVGESRKRAFDDKMSLLLSAKTSLEATKFAPKEMQKAGIKVSADGNRRSAFEILSFPDVSFANLIMLDKSLSTIRPDIQTQLSCDALYANYIERQNRDVEKMKRDEAHEIPDDFDYTDLKGLSNELRSKLVIVRPQTIGQASRVEGMTPAACTLILARLRQANRKKVSNA